MLDSSNDRAAIESPSRSVLPWAYPLDEFYSLSGLPLPSIRQIGDDDLPEPFRSLLVHRNDMTPTLERFHNDRLHVHALRRERRNSAYFREVVLEKDGDDLPVEFGAIKINLNLFSSKARQLILAEREPLGHIMCDCNVAHSSNPKAYLQLEADDLIGRALRVKRGTVLYGRRNTLFDPLRHPLAEIVEILPPEPAGDPDS